MLFLKKDILPWVLSLLALAACKSKPSEPALFTPLDSTQTAIGFRNDLPANDKLNIVEYLYYYNGGGVAAGDVNNDGLTDLYFVANRGKNKLYLNKGGFKFEDVTEKAGVGGFADWQTGVTMTDVNGDGWLDIYVCAVSNYKGLEGSNELYINNHDGTFSEKASEYGLDFQGFSTQAAFFDYDHDGDLDCYLLNHAVHTSRAYDQVSTRYLRDQSAGDVLYRNELQGAGGKGQGAKSDNPVPSASRSHRFTNISEQAGIYGAAMGYGLGVVVSDFNNDGWEDLYVSNDFHEDDYLYLNQKNGTFREAMREQMGHLSRFSMGCDAADVNNDGFPDLMTLDMYPADETVEKSSGGEDSYDLYLYKLQFGYHYQFSRNCLQINQQGKKFSEIGAFAGVAATDWSWSPLLADFDNDGVKDLFVTNGIVKRPNDLDYIKYINTDTVYYSITMMKSKAFDQPSIAMMPEGKAHNYVFQGTKSLQFEDKSEAWGFTKKTFSNGSVYADLDNDGDLDLVTNDLNDAAGLFRNEASTVSGNHFLKIKLQGNGGNRFGVGAKVVAKTGDSLQTQTLMPTRGFLSSVEPVLTFGLGKTARVDSLFILWNTGEMQVLANVKPNATLTLKQADAKRKATDFVWIPKTKPLFDSLRSAVLPFRHRENSHFDFNRESLMPFFTSTEGPRLAVGDLNGDGLDDVVATGAKNQGSRVFMQRPDGSFAPSRQPAVERDSLNESVDAVLFDADGDKDLDLYVVTGGNEFYGTMPELADHLYLNDGKGGLQPAPPGSLPPMFDNKSCVRVADFDRDGDLDLFVGGRVVGYAYGQSPKSYLLVNDGKGRFSDKTDALAPELRRAGMLTDATWADTDQDGDLDLLVVGEWMEPKLFVNGKGKFATGSIQSPNSEIQTLSGLWHAVAAADFDHDGDLDFVLGNLGTNTKLRKSGDQSGLRMAVGDFDHSGSTEQIVSYKSGNRWYPMAAKDELGKQLPGIINKKFNEYKAYAGKTVDEIFDKGQLDKGLKLEINQFASVYLENKGGNQFVVRELPKEVQWSRVMAFLPTDADGDSKLDLLVGGNFYGVNPYQGRYDASYGLVLRGDGKGGFAPLTFAQSGFLLDGEVRDLKTVRTAKGPLVLVGRNNAAVQVFRKN